MILDLFAGIGWGYGLRAMGLAEVGMDSNPGVIAARQLAARDREEAPLPTLGGDVRDYRPGTLGRLNGLIASPPCQSFSAAGKRRGLADDRGQLVWEVERIALAELPAWIVCEQVPAVLPIWDRIAETLRREGYSTATALLSAEQYGVPQTRKRAFLWASRITDVHVPEPTHQKYRKGVDRVPRDDHESALEPWVSMGEALELHGLLPDADAVNTGRDFREKGNRASGQTRSVESPAPTITAKSGGQWQWWWERPATTVACDRRLWPPGHKVNQADRDRLGEAEANRRYGDRAGTKALRLTREQGLILQGFRPDTPLPGRTLTEDWRIIGNAVPPTWVPALLSGVGVRPAD